MTHEFDHVRESFASSGPGRTLAAVRRSAESGWRSSSFRAALRWLAARPASTPMLIRALAAAICVAAALQPLLIWMMPRTVKPAMPPYLFVAIALLAAAAAWRSDDVVRALPTSRFARWLSR